MDVISARRSFTMNPISEFNFISWAQKQIGDDPSVLLPSGDDTAILKTTNKTAFTTDALVDQVHFDLQTQRPSDIGQKAINVNVSDIASMGMQPSHCVITFCVPHNLSQQKLKAIFNGMIKACRQSQLSIVGGDFTRSPKALMINVAMTGRLIKKNTQPLTRSGAKIGDSIFVTGSLGGSITGKHLRFKPRLLEVKELLKLGNPTSMIDISDGLSSELHHICKQSKVGSKIFCEQIPIANKNTNTLDNALNDGEDFELLFTADAKLTKKIDNNWTLKTKLTKIGEICHKSNGIKLFKHNQYLHKLPAKGWCH